ncbi:MAG: hypothetical protein ACK6BM_07420 [Cyanobacteriota bacterium]
MFKIFVPTVFSALVFCCSTPARAIPCHEADIRCAHLVQMGQDYPFVKDRPASSYLFVSGGVYPFESFNQRLSSATVVVPGEKQAMPVDRLLQLLQEHENAGKKRTPVIAYGSNPAPWVLIEKFTRSTGSNKEYNGSMVIPVTKATLRNFDITWLPYITDDAGLPATLSASPGTEVEVWLTWLDDDQLALMNTSEFVGQAGSMYSLNVMPRQQLNTKGYTLQEDPLVYVSCYGSLRAANGDALAIAQIPARNRKLQAMNTIDTMAYAAKRLAFKGTGFELLADNARNLHKESIRKQRNTSLQSRSVPSPTLALHSPQTACRPDAPMSSP